MKNYFNLLRDIHSDARFNSKRGGSVPRFAEGEGSDQLCAKFEGLIDRQKPANGTQQIARDLLHALLFVPIWPACAEQGR